MTETRGATAAAPERRSGAAPPERRGLGGLRSLPSRLSLYYRQVVAELRKVIWPTRQQLVTYTMVVMVFVTVVIAIVAALDFVFTKLVLWLLA